MKPDACPNCGYKVDAVSVLDGKEATPKTGDFSLCLSCGALNRFNADLMLVQSTPEDISDLHPDDFAQVRKAQSIIRKRGPIG